LRINAELARQAEAARVQLVEVTKLAQANTAAAEQVRVLQKQLSTSEGLKQENFNQLGERTAHNELMAGRSERLAVQLAEGGGPEVEQLKIYGEQQRENARKELVSVMEGLLAGRVSSGADFRNKLEEVGYSTGKNLEGKQVIIDEGTGAKFQVHELKPSGQELGIELAKTTERTALEVAQEAKREQGRGQSRGRGKGI